MFVMNFIASGFVTNWGSIDSGICHQSLPENSNV